MAYGGGFAHEIAQNALSVDEVTVRCCLMAPGTRSFDLILRESSASELIDGQLTGASQPLRKEAGKLTASVYDVLELMLPRLEPARWAARKGLLPRAEIQVDVAG